MGQKLKLIRESITDLCHRLDDLKEELTRVSEEDGELVLSQFKSIKEELDNDLAEVYNERVILRRISIEDTYANIIGSISYFNLLYLLGMCINFCNEFFVCIKAEEENKIFQS